MTDVPPQPPKELTEKAREEVLALRANVAEATLAWAEIENAMVIFLTRILNRDNTRIPAAMYFALSGIDSRISMVSNGFTELLHEFGEQERDYAENLASLWTTLENKLKRLKSTRNRIAHGQIVHAKMVEYEKGAYYAFPLLTSPAADFVRFREANESNKLPGLSSNDIAVHVKSVSMACKLIKTFTDCTQILHSGQLDALPEKLAELEVARQAQGGPPSTQTPQAPGNPPRSSRR